MKQKWIFRELIDFQSEIDENVYEGTQPLQKKKYHINLILMVITFEYADKVFSLKNILY